MTHENNLEAVLKERGISKAELARRVGISPQNLNRYFKGTRTPSDVMLQKIADALGMQVSVTTHFFYEK